MKDEKYIILSKVVKTVFATTGVSTFFSFIVLFIYQGIYTHKTLLNSQNSDSGIEILGNLFIMFALGNLSFTGLFNYFKKARKNKIWSYISFAFFPILAFVFILIESFNSNCSSNNLTFTLLINIFIFIILQAYFHKENFNEYWTISN